ncbi:MAG: AI-2E family transporter [Acetobacteraceae bacterium]|nr:AI-2E family transporter [Acetobacteraceae bacterium]
MKYGVDVIAERILMGLLLAGIAVGCWLVLQPFLSAIFWAAILVFTTWPVFTWLRYRLGGRGTWAAAIMVLLTSVLIVLPLALAAPAGADDVNLLRKAIEDQLAAGLPEAPSWVSRIPVVGPTIAGYWNEWAADLSRVVDVFRPYFGMIAESGLKVMLNIASGLLQFILALVVAFFFYATGDTLADHLERIMHRIAGERAPRLIEVTGATVRGTVYGILGTAVVQGLLTTFGLWLSGVPRPLLLGAIAGFIAVLPIGAPVVWIPAALWLIGTGHMAWGIFLGAYGLLIVSGSDNVIRPYFIARGAKLPFLLTILGVLGGAIAFGLLGIFLGPVLLGMGFMLVAEFSGADPLVMREFTSPARTLRRPRVPERVDPDH